MNDLLHRYVIRAEMAMSSWGTAAVLALSLLSAALIYPTHSSILFTLGCVATILVVWAYNTVTRTVDDLTLFIRFGKPLTKLGFPYPKGISFLILAGVLVVNVGVEPNKLSMAALIVFVFSSASVMAADLARLLLEIVRQTYRPRRQ